jgi:Mlc titration factor MtfA (ptsG expression regulator)
MRSGSPCSPRAPSSPRSPTTSNGDCARLAEDFLAGKEFTSRRRLRTDDAICVSIAAQGCLPILELGLDYYRGWVGVIVYPDEFIIPRSVEDEFGVVHEYQEVASGEAWEGGPLLISWRDAQMAGERLQRRHPRVRAQARHAEWRSRRHPAAAAGNPAS